MAVMLNQYCSVTLGRPVVISSSLVVSQKQTILVICDLTWMLQMFLQCDVLLILVMNKSLDDMHC